MQNLKNKILFSFIFLLQSQLMICQKKEITVIDITTKKPLENVNVYYSEINEGTFTNTEGKATINIKEFDLKISAINYEEIIVKSVDIKNSTTILLTQKATVLDEVVVSSFNLKKALNYVLENYDNLYENKPFEKECNFKETLSVDNSLKRLILSKINWWGKSYKVKYLDDLKLRLISINFNKEEPLNIFTELPEENTSSKSNYIDTKNLVSYIYLNTFLNAFLPRIENASIIIENSPTDEIIISYETEWKLVKDYSIRNKGKIIFDKVTKAIMSLTEENEIKNLIINGMTSISKKPYSFENKSSLSVLNFKKSTNNKLTLNSYEVNANFNISYKNRIHLCNLKNSIYVLKETPTKKVSNDGIMDLTKPICNNIPLGTIINSNTIMLSEEEKIFIFGTK